MRNDARHSVLVDAVDARRDRHRNNVQNSESVSGSSVGNRDGRQQTLHTTGETNVGNQADTSLFREDVRYLSRQSGQTDSNGTNITRTQKRKFKDFLKENSDFYKKKGLLKEVIQIYNTTPIYLNYNKDKLKSAIDILDGLW